MGWGWWYLIAAAVTQVLSAFAARRRGEPWSDAVWWLIIWPVGLMWPLMVCSIVAEIIDGPYKAKHRVQWY